MLITRFRAALFPTLDESAACAMGGVMKVYAIANVERKCGGMGDYFDEKIIKATGAYGDGEWRPVYRTREAAVAAISSEKFGSNLRVVELELKD